MHRVPWPIPASHYLNIPMRTSGVPASLSHSPWLTLLVPMTLRINVNEGLTTRWRGIPHTTPPNLGISECS